MSRQKKILILDGDSIAYRCSAAGEERGIQVKHSPTGITKEFKTRTEFKNLMLEKGKEITDLYEVSDIQRPEPLSFVLKTINQHVDRIVQEVKPDELRIFAGEHNNFRLDLPLPKRYKGNRKDSLRPIHLKEAKEHLAYKYNATEAFDKEVDDECSLVAYNALKNGHKPIMYFYEKDQYQLDGITLLYDNEEFVYEEVPVLGNLRLEKEKTVKGLGLKFLAFQWICFDKVDNYSAYDLSSVKFGEKSAYKVLKDLETERDVLLAVIQQFMTFYPKPFDYKDWSGKEHTEVGWKDMLLMYYRCARMMRHQNDKLDARGLFTQYDIDLDEFMLE